MSIGTFLTALGFPSYAVTMILVMIVGVSVFGILKWMTGRSDKGME